MRTLESNLQQACIRWFRIQYPQYNLLLFSVPNEGQRTRANASRMKAEGMVAGVADLILLVPRGKYHGLCIEMKAGKGKQTENQTAWQNEVEKQGYRYEVCRSFEEFESLIKKYIKI